MLVGVPGSFVNFIDFAPLKPEKEQAFHDWFRRSSEAFAKHPGFISRTLLGPIEGGHRYAAVVEFESKETFMDMHLSDDRVEMFRQGEPLIVGSSTPQFYQSLLIHRKRENSRRPRATRAADQDQNEGDVMEAKDRIRTAKRKDEPR